MSRECWVEAINSNNCIGRETGDNEIVGIAPEAQFEFTPPCENKDGNFSDETNPYGGATFTGWN